MKKIITGIFLTIFGGLLGRWHGGGFFKAPKQVKSLIWALPFAFCAVVILKSVEAPTWVQITVPLLVLIGDMIGLNTGHGGFMDFGTWLLARGKEKLEFIIFWLRGKVTERVYDALGLVVIGTARNLSPALFMVFFNPLASLVLIISGALSHVLGYWIGWTVYPEGQRVADSKFKQNFDEATEWGEFISKAILMLGRITAMIIWAGALSTL